MTARFLAVKNYRDFQHYSDRLPPWIKLYYSLLDDYGFLQLTEVQQIHLVLIWLVASRHDNRIPYDEKYIRAAIRAKKRVDLAALVSAGFLTVVHASAGASPHASNGASPPRVQPRTHATEAEAETESTSSSGASGGTVAGRSEAKIAALLPTDADRAALAALLARVPARSPWCHEMLACLEGMGGHHVLTPAQLGEALRDYAGNGAISNPNLRQFRRYLESAARPPEMTPHRARNGSGANGSLSLDQQIAALEELKHA